MQPTASQSPPPLDLSWRTLVKTERTLEPRHHISFPGSVYIYEVQFSPDGRTAYCLVDGQSVDLWAAGISKWPEALGGVAALAVLIYFLVFARIRRRPQTPGDPHCRRCNYNVVAQAAHSVKARAHRRLPDRGTLCPECGADLSLKRPRRGRSIRRRLLIPSTVVGLLLLGYSSLFLFKIPRGAVTVYSPWISSAWVDALVEKHQTRWLLPHRTRVNRIMTVDTESGRIIGCLRSIRGPVTGGMKIAPDGRRLAVADAGWLRWISASSGRCIALTTAGTFNSGYQNEFIAGFDGAAHDPWVYFAAADMSRGVSRLVRWRPRTGEQLVVVEEPAFAMTYKNGATAPLTRRYAILHRKDGIATASAPDFMQSYHEKDFSITIRAPESAGGAVERTFRVTDPFVETSPMIAHPGGDRISLLSGTFGLVDYETATGKRLQALRASGTEIPDRAMDLSPDGSRLVLPVHGQSVLVYDVPRKRWHARLNYPAPFIGPKVSISPDRRWVAAMPFKSTGAGPTGAPYLHELFLFDLGAP